MNNNLLCIQHARLIHLLANWNSSVDEAQRSMTQLFVSQLVPQVTQTRKVTDILLLGVCIPPILTCANSDPGIFPELFWGFF